jgi:RecA-family ATPase
MLSLSEIARVLGGEVASGQVRAPGRGHSVTDRSLSIKINDAGDDIVVYSFADGDCAADQLDAKDYVRQKLGLGAWQSKKRENGTCHPLDEGVIDALSTALAKTPTLSAPKAVVARYDYTDTNGTLLYQVERWQPKTFTQRRPDGRGGWIYKGVFEGIGRVPYRWPELAREIAEFPDAPVFLTEGEKDCDNVRALGLTATCMAGAVWTPEIVANFKDRDVIFLEDNDSAGREKSAKAAETLFGVAASIRIARFTDLPEKSDVSDWIQLAPEKHNADALIERCRTAPIWEAPASPTVERAPLRWLDMSAWDGEPLPDRKWAIRDRVPLNQAGLFSGEGGTGKSILELTKNVAHVIGKDWLGSMPEYGPAFYLGAEDDADEIQIRLAAIARHYGVTFKDLIHGGLRILPLLGQDATLCAPNKSGKIEVTDLYREIYEAAGDIKPKNISVDTLSRAFAGNEIDRVQVYAFAMNMQALAKVANGSVTVLSHPSLAGINSGSGISGSTAWHGAFRFRQYLKSAKADPGEQPDDDLRELEFKKNQYGPKGESIVLRYQRGLFLPEAGVSNLDKLGREIKAEEIFLDLLRRFTREGRNISHVLTAPTNAPAAFAREAEAKKFRIGKDDLKGAMSRLFAANKIFVEQYGRPSRPSSRLAVRQ